MEPDTPPLAAKEYLLPQGCCVITPIVGAAFAKWLTKSTGRSTTPYNVTLAPAQAVPAQTNIEATAMFFIYMMGFASPFMP